MKKLIWITTESGNHEELVDVVKELNRSGLRNNYDFVISENHIKTISYEQVLSIIEELKTLSKEMEGKN